MDRPTLDYIAANQATLLADLHRQLAIVRDFVRQVADSCATGAYLYGVPGRRRPTPSNKS